MKKKSEFLSENFQFLEVKFWIYLNRRVFVMKMLAGLLLPINSADSDTACARGLIWVFAEKYVRYYILSRCCPNYVVAVQQVKIYHSLGKFSRHHIDFIFFIFPRKQDLIVHANYFRWSHFAWISKCHLLKNLPCMLSVKVRKLTIRRKRGHQQVFWEISPM